MIANLNMCCGSRELSGNYSYLFSQAPHFSHFLSSKAFCWKFSKLNVEWLWLKSSIIELWNDWECQSFFIENFLHKEWHREKNKLLIRQQSLALLSHFNWHCHIWQCPSCTSSRRHSATDFYSSTVDAIEFYRKTHYPICCWNVYRTKCPLGHSIPYNSFSDNRPQLTSSPS